MAPTRMPSLVGRVPTKFGSLYVTVAFDPLTGAARDVRLSYPGKHAEKEVGLALDAIAEMITHLIEEGSNGEGRS